MGFKHSKRKSMINISWNDKLNTKNKPVSFKARPIPADVLYTFKKILANKKLKTIDVFCHASPDDDTVNSAAPVIRLLKKYGKEVYVCVNKKKTKELFFSPTNIKKDSNPSQGTLTLDFNGYSKVPTSFKELFRKTDSKNIFGFDHHLPNEDTFKGNLYIDISAKSCSGVIFRLFEGLGEKLHKKDLKNLYCGMLSDYQKSKLVKIEKGKLIKTEYLDADKNSKEILDKLEKKLSEKDKTQIINHLDVLANLSPIEKQFMKRIFSEVEVTKNGKMAYLVIDAEDADWKALGMDNFRTSEILRYLRLKLINNVQASEKFTSEQKLKMQNLQGAAIFYRAESVYQISMHSKPDGVECTELLEQAMKNFSKYAQEKGSTLKIDGGGHPHRAGGRMHSLEKEDVKQFVKSFMDAFDKID